MKKDICGILGIKYPIFQGGMAWVSESTLAAGSFQCWRTWYYSRG